MTDEKLEAWLKDMGLPTRQKRGMHNYTEVLAEVLALLPFIAMFVGICLLLASAS